MYPDHYYLDKSESTQYIFDSKYYTQLNKLDTKQFVYHILLYKKALKTYNSIIMPTTGKTKTEVFLTHLNTQDVLKNFVK